MSEDQAKYAVEKNEYEVMRQPQIGMFLNEQRFEFAQRIGKMLAASTMLPEHFRNNLGNCLIALNLAERLGLDVFGLMQTSYVVHGRPGFEAKLLIAIFNSRTQLFIPPLRWEFKGDFPKGKDAGCRAYAVDKETHEPLYGEWIDWDLVTAEGWEKKTGSKWLTMPGQMYRYRAASFFINAYEPGLKMGIHTVDEIQDMVIDVTPTFPAPTLPGLTNGASTEDKPGAKVYEFKSDTKEPAPETKEPKPETKEPEPEKQAEEHKPDLGKKEASAILAEIKAARPKASDNAKSAFKDLYIHHRDFILSLEGADFEYAKGKFVNAGYDWGNDFLGANPAQVATSLNGEANGSNQSEKTGIPPIVDFGEGETAAGKEPTFTDRAFAMLSELTPEARKGVLKLYGITAEWPAVNQALDKLAPGYQEAFLQRCSKQLDLQNAKGK